MRIALIFSFLFFLLANSSAQTSESNEDPKPKFGINMGLNYSFAKADEPLPTGASLSNGFGFRLEMLAEQQLFNRVFVSPKVGFSFHDSAISFDESLSDEMPTYALLPVSFDIAAHIIIKKSSPNRRPYLYAGSSIKIPVQERADKDKPSGSSWTPTVDFGLGFDKDFGYFQFAPEIRYSIGYQNVSNQNITGDIFLHNLSIIFNFLG